MTAAARSGGGPLRLLAWTLVILPAVILLAYAAIYAVNGPEWDHLPFAEIFDRWNRGQFTLEYLFRQHNEHRIAAVRLVVLGLGSLTRWNNRPEAVAHWALMCATALILFRAFRRDAGLAGTTAMIAFAPMAWLLASPRSYEALFGIGFPHYMSILGFSGVLSILVFGPTTFAALAGAIACGLLASFSLANGLLAWPIGLLVLLCHHRVDPPRETSWARTIIWSLAGALTYAGYFYGYVDPGNHTSPHYVIEHPGAALVHFLGANGSSLGPDPTSAPVFGAVLLILEAIVILGILASWWRRRVRPPMGVWLIVTVLISCAMITLNRAGFGLIQALESRYTALTVLAPIGVYWCMVARRDQSRAAPVLITPVATLLVLGYLLVSVQSWGIAPEWYSRKSWKAYLVYSAKYQPISILEKLYANPLHARAYSAALERLHYNVFAEDHVRPETLSLTAPQPAFIVETVNEEPVDLEHPIEIGEDGALVVKGWAFNDHGTGPAREVLLSVDGTRDYPAHIGIYKDGLGGGIRRRDRRWAGLIGSIGGFVLEPGAHTIALKIVADDGRRAFLTDPVARVIRR
jgi:hypothetical protein